MINALNHARLLVLFSLFTMGISLASQANALTVFGITIDDDKLAEWCEKPDPEIIRFPRLFERFKAWKNNFCEQFANQAPVAVTAGPGVVGEYSYFSLDGSGSSDPDGDPLTYTWVQLAGPDAIPVAAADSASPQYYVPPASSGEQMLFELTVSDGDESTSQQVAVDVRTCAGDEGQIFDDCTHAGWYGFSAWQMLDDGSFENFNYDTGYNDNLISWQLVETDEPGYESVVEASYQDITGVNGLFRVFTEYGAGATTDLTDYAGGTVQFDARVLDWGSAGAEWLEFRLECIYPCESGIFTLQLPELGEWVHFSIPVDALAASGLDLANVEIGFQLAPPWAQQSGVRFQVDNVAWTHEPPATTPSDTTEVVFTFDTAESVDAWDMLFTSSVPVEANKYFDTTGAMGFAPVWSNAFGFTVHRADLPHHMNLSNGEVSLDVAMDASLLNGGEVYVDLFLIDASGIIASTTVTSSSLVAGYDGYLNYLAISSLEDLTNVNEGFDISNIAAVGIGIFSMDKDLSVLGSILIDNLRLVAHDGVPPGTLILADLWSWGWEMSIQTGNPVFSGYSSSSNSLEYSPLLLSAGDSYLHLNNMLSPMNLTGGSISADVEYPVSYDGSEIVVDLVVVDGSGAIATLESVRPTPGTVSELRVENLGSTGVDVGMGLVDITDIRQVGLRFTFENDPTSGEIYQVSQFVVRVQEALQVPPTGSEPPPTDQYNWNYGVYTDGAQDDIFIFGPTSSGFSFTPVWADGISGITVDRHFDYPVDLTGGRVSLDVYVPQSAVGSPAYFELQISDIYNQGGLVGTLSLDSVSSEGWYTLQVDPLFVENLVSTDFGFNPQLITSVSLKLWRNGSVPEATGEFQISNFEILSASQVQNPPDSGSGVEFNPGSWYSETWNGNPTYDWSAENRQLVVSDLQGYSDDNFVFINYLPQITNLNGGALSAELYMPQVYVDTPMLIQPFFFDADYNYATPGATYIPNLAAYDWSDISLDNIDISTFEFASEGFSMANIQAVGFQVILLAELPPVSEPFIIGNLELTAGTGEDPGVEENHYLNWNSQPGSSTSDASYFADASNFYTEFNFNGELDVALVTYTPTAPLNLNGGGFGFDLYIPAEAGEAGLSTRLIARDSQGYSAATPAMSLAGMGNAWFNMSLDPFEPYQFASVDEGFNANSIVEIQLEVSSDQVAPGYLGMFTIGSMVVYEGYGNGGWTDSTPQPDVIIPDWQNWGMEVWQGDSVVDFSSNDANQLSFRPVSVLQNDNIALLNYLPSQVDLTGGELSASMVVPEAFSNANVFVRMFLFDASYRYASLPPVNTVATPAGTAIPLDYQSLSLDQFDYVADGFELGAVIAVGYHLVFAEDMTDVAEPLILENTQLTPGTPVTLEPSITESMYVTTQAGSTGVGWSADSTTLTVYPEWGAEINEFAAHYDFPAVMDLTNADISFDILLGSEYLVPGLTFELALFDSNDNIATKYAVSAADLQADSWNNYLEIAVGSEPYSFRNLGFDSTQVSALEIRIRGDETVNWSPASAIQLSNIVISQP